MDLYPIEYDLLIMAERIKPSSMGYQTKEQAYEDLKKYTKQDFGYDIQAWYAWMIATKNLSGFMLFEVYDAEEAYDAGIKSFELKDYENALLLFQNALKFFGKAKEISSREFLFESLLCKSYIAKTYKNIGDIPNFLQTCEDAIKLSPAKFQDLFFIQLAYYHLEKKDAPKALELFEMTRELVLEFGGVRQHASTLIGMSQALFLEDKHLELAIDYAEQAKSILEHIELSNEKSIEYVNMLIFYIQKRIDIKLK